MHTSTELTGPGGGVRFYTAHEYHAQLIAFLHAARPGDRILLMTMTFDPTEPAIAAIAHETIQAARRGVHVTMAVDAHSFLLNKSHLPGPLWPRRAMPKRLPALYRGKLAVLEAINEQPTGHADIINIPQRGFSLPVAGRSHIKAAIVNNYVFIGGCNLQDETQIDLMAGMESAATADILHDTLQKIIHGKHAGLALGGSDRGIYISDDTQLLIDSGVRRQSLIFDEALQLIDSARQWLVITGQFFPNSITAKHLVAAAKRGVKLEIIYTHPRHHGLIGGMGQHISILREKTRVPKELFRHALGRKDPMLHAKLIASDAGVMVGSHNYVAAGVILGTAEIALKSTDTELARESVRVLHRGLGKST